ncbi:ICE2-domain-containing protein [Naematelia encephala]|uniref:ICE2-domain-containing protein n=1 Tax=Naematelia encephala TaxID=71784 RepID=A0A1Y2AMT8_9TREE|nr:ICE2-domain-containing protein [Naematelia encephala]
MVVAAMLSFGGGMATFSQVLLALPMSLDLLGPPSFLLLSLLFTLHHILYSTLRLLLKNTPFAPLITILSFLSPFISSSLVLVTFYFYLHPPAASSTLGHVVVNVLPYLYASVLRWVSPLFTLLEGISTLLVVQVAGRVGKGWADEEEKEEGVEWRSLAGLVAAALVYCAGLAGVVKTFPPSSESSLPAFLLGAALTTVVFLSLIGFTLRRTNVLETSLVFVYVVYSAWLSGVEAAMEPRQFGSAWFSPSPYWTPKSLPFTSATPTIQALARRATIGVVDSLANVASTLPPHLLLSLIYRVTVLHLAARIVPMIRKGAMGWDDGMEEKEPPGFWDGRSLGEEPANMRVTTVVLSYRRAILIAVYTHLLLLDAGSQTWWRWINIALFLSVWSLELLLDAEGDDTESVTRWKVD